MDKNSLHFKGNFRNIYEVNRAYPNGGVRGDYVDINGWQHWWDVDRGTWCVNENRDTYWDEILSTLQNIVYSKACVSESDFPSSPSADEQRVAYFYNGELYLYTGTNGTVRNGQYRSFGVVQGQKGVGVSSIAQTETSNVDGGKNVITVTLTNGDTYKFFTYNGTGRNKGYYYKSLNELSAAVPSPALTDWAIVDGEVYVCEEAGTWKSTGYSWKPVKLNPLLQLLNVTDKPNSAGYLHWNGSSFNWQNPVVSSGGGTSSGGGGVSQSELQAAIKNAMKGYSWWGRKFGDGTAISGNIEGVNSISFRNTAATITKNLSLDANGNLCFDGNFYATGGITALGQSSISGGGTSGGGSALEIVRTVGTSAGETLTTAAKKLNFILAEGWNSRIIQKANEDGSEVNIHLDLLPISGGTSGTTTNPLTIYNSNGVGWKFNGSTALGLKFGAGLSASVSNDVITVDASGSGTSSGSLPYKFYVKCKGVALGEGFDGSSGMAINLIEGDGIKISGSDTTWGNKNITISATGSSSSGGSTSGDVLLNNMLYFYGSETAGGTPSVKGGYDNSGKIYLKFQGNGVTVTAGTTNTYGDTTIVNIPGGGGSSSSSVSWSDITGKPSTFTPSSHTHTASDITGFDSAVQAVKVNSASKADTLANARTIWGRSFNGSANITGALSSVTDVNLTGSIKWSSGTSYGNGFMELYYSTPYIDFHYNKSASDYTARLIADGENLLSFLTNSGTGIFDIQNNKLKIGNGYLVWDDTNKAFRMTSSNGGNCNFYCDGGITALGVQSTTTSGSDFSFRNVTADCFKAVKKDTSNILYFAKGDEDFLCYFDASNNLVLSCSDNLYINSAKIAPDGWITCPEIFCTESGNFECDGSYLRLGDDDNNANVVFYDSGNAYKLNMSKAISLGVFTQLSTQELTTLEARTKKKVSA